MKKAKLFSLMLSLVVLCASLTAQTAKGSVKPDCDKAKIRELQQACRTDQAPPPPTNLTAKTDVGRREKTVTKTVTQPAAPAAPPADDKFSKLFEAFIVANQQNQTALTEIQKTAEEARLADAKSRLIQAETGDKLVAVEKDKVGVESKDADTRFMTAKAQIELDKARLTNEKYALKTQRVHSWFIDPLDHAIDATGYSMGQAFRSTDSFNVNTSAIGTGGAGGAGGSATNANTLTNQQSQDQSQKQAQEQDQSQKQNQQQKVCVDDDDKDKDKHHHDGDGNAQNNNKKHKHKDCK